MSADLKWIEEEPGAKFVPNPRASEPGQPIGWYEIPTLIWGPISNGIIRSLEDDQECR